MREPGSCRQGASPDLSTPDVDSWISGGSWESGGGGDSWGRRLALASRALSLSLSLVPLLDDSRDLESGVGGLLGRESAGQERFGASGPGRFLCDLKVTAQLRWGPDGARMVVGQGPLAGSHGMGAK